MENVISARRLRKSVLNSVGDVDLELYNLNKPRSYKEKSIKYSNVKNEDNILLKFKTKLIIKLFFCSVILFSVIVSKMFFIEDIKSNTNIVRLYNHYITHFSRECILGKIEYRIDRMDQVVGNIIPTKIKEYIQEKYLSSVKSYILTFDLKSSFKEFINLETDKKDLSSIIEDENIIEAADLQKIDVEAIEEEPLIGIGGAEPLEESEIVISSISIMDLDIENIKSRNISIIAPVSGVITSKYGVREEVFVGVDPYHTGVDIANKKGTEIKSATKGVVTKIENDNKYYGNFIEITENEVIFKYAHLDSINVNLGDIINQEDTIGLMGSTGMSTGNHLHFEIRIDGRTVNPEELVKL
jgi:murein DD-endopeptidase MepM/ murein hydrolase activator NlpD